MLAHDARTAARSWNFIPEAFKGYHNIPDPAQIERQAQAVNIHSGQPDQQKVLDFYGKEVLPRLLGNGGAAAGGARSH
jgi:hypothetical protein